MKLYELPRNSYFQIVDGETNTVKDTYLFKHVDGMYSVCYDKDKTMHHIAAWTEVEKVNEPASD